MTTIDYDAVIAGGGLSGLSLAAHLAAGSWRDRAVLVVDDPASRPAAARWGSWVDTPGLLDAVAKHSWRRVWVHADGESHLVPLGGYRYQVVGRADLHREVRERLASCPRFVHRPGRVQAVRDRPGAAEVVIDGELVRARWVFDSVGTPTTSKPPDARLAFTGWDVHYAEPVFDPDTPTLLDFRTAPAGGARFVYVLPDDPYRALVEVTEFVPRHGQPPTQAARWAALDAYLVEVLNAGGYDIARTESATVPLRVRPPARRTGRVLRIGAHGGLVKATTGYAYQRIQRDSEAIAASLARHEHPFDLPAPRRRHRLLDALLLDVLDRDPAQLELAFARLFFANPAERVLRFLDERSDLRDELRIMASMPSAPYLRAIATRALPRRPWHHESRERSRLAG